MRQPKSTHLKTQTPIVAKLTLCEWVYHNNISGICIFNKFNTVIVAKKRVNYPLEKKIHPYFHLLS